MATTKTVLFLFAILAPSTIILAQESSSAPPPPEASNETDAHHTLPPPHDDDGSHEPIASSAPGMFDHFPFKAPQFDFNNFSWPQFPGAELFEGSSRQKRSPLESNRHTTGCNYAAQGASMCLSCNTVRHCVPIFNIGIVATCTGDTPYCKDRQCSKTKGPLCKSTTSTSSSSSSSSSSSTSTSTSTTSTEPTTTIK